MIQLRVKNVIWLRVLSTSSQRQYIFAQGSRNDPKELSRMFEGSPAQTSHFTRREHLESFYELPKAQQFEGATHVVKVLVSGQDWWPFGTYVQPVHHQSYEHLLNY